MIHTETKFAYRHKSTGKWCHLEQHSRYSNGKLEYFGMGLDLIDDFQANRVVYSAKNIIEEDLLRSTMNGERYAALNFLEFELVEIEIQYKIKEEE